MEVPVAVFGIELDLALILVGFASLLMVGLGLAIFVWESWFDRWLK